MIRDGDMVSGEEERKSAPKWQSTGDAHVKNLQVKSLQTHLGPTIRGHPSCSGLYIARWEHGFLMTTTICVLPRCCSNAPSRSSTVRLNARLSSPRIDRSTHSLDDG